MVTRRCVIRTTTAGLLIGGIGWPVRAAKHAVFEQQAFAQAQAAGLPILIHVTAPWCPTCRAQKPVVEKLATASEFAALVIFDVDFDSQTDALRLFNAQRQSTLIAFSGKTETGRSVGATDAASIGALLKSAIGQ